MTQPSQNATAGWKNFAMLREDSPFLPIFPDGRVPIMNQFGPSEVMLGLGSVGASPATNELTEVYFVDWSALTLPQRALIGHKVIELRGGTFRDFIKHMTDGGRLPLHVSQTTSAQLGADLRLFV